MHCSTKYENAARHLTLNLRKMTNRTLGSVAHGMLHFMWTCIKMRRSVGCFDIKSQTPSQTVGDHSCHKILLRRSFSEFETWGCSEPDSGG